MSQKLNLVLRNVVVVVCSLSCSFSTLSFFFCFVSFWFACTIQVLFGISMNVTDVYVGMYVCNCMSFGGLTSTTFFNIFVCILLYLYTYLHILCNLLYYVSIQRVKIDFNWEFHNIFIMNVVAQMTHCNNGGSSSSNNWISTWLHWKTSKLKMEKNRWRCVNGCF